MGSHHASPVYAAGHVYFLNDEGVAHVIKAGAKYELIASNEIGEKTYASLAISDGQIFLRSFKNLYCIAAGDRTKAAKVETKAPLLSSRVSGLDVE
jgi:outer membrane protein assembly factor BamB